MASSTRPAPVTALNTDGSRTETVADLNLDGSLRSDCHDDERQRPFGDDTARY